MNELSYDKLKLMYDENFSLGYINKDIGSKFFLISAICAITQMAKRKKPDITYWQIVYNLSDKMGLPEKFLKSLAVICEDFAYGCSDFPTFGVEKKDLIPRVQEILGSYMPF